MALFTEDTITGNLLPLPLSSKAATVLLQTYFKYTTKEQRKVAHCALQKILLFATSRLHFAPPCPGRVVAERSPGMPEDDGLIPDRVSRKLKFEVKFEVLL